jgi:hypothetical protein
LRHSGAERGSRRGQQAQHSGGNAHHLSRHREAAPPRDTAPPHGCQEAVATGVVKEGPGLALHSQIQPLSAASACYPSAAPFRPRDAAATAKTAATAASTRQHRRQAGPRRQRAHIYTCQESRWCATAPVAACSHSRHAAPAVAACTAAPCTPAPVHPPQTRSQRPPHFQGRLHSAPNPPCSSGATWRTEAVRSDREVHRRQTKQRRIAATIAKHRDTRKPVDGPRPRYCFSLHPRWRHGRMHQLHPCPGIQGTARLTSCAREPRAQRACGSPFRPRP